MSMRSRYKFLLVVLILHLPLFAYPILRLCYWLGLSSGLTTAILVPLFFSQVIVRVYFKHSNTRLVFWLRRAADLWLGISPLLLCMLLAAELPVALNLISAHSAAYLLIGLTVALTTYSVINAYAPSIVTVSLESKKLKSQVRFVQITDVHIGSRSTAFLTRVMDRVNSLSPEFLCITGDFIDARGISEQSLAALRTCPVPIYFSTGNHEQYEDFEDILRRLSRLGVNVLRTETAIHGDVQLIGIDDSERPDQVARELARLQVDHRRFALLLYHRPRGHADAAAAGVDLMISGHTHNGQIVPFNFVVGRVFEQTVGLFKTASTHLYVSPGTGTWGPVMRLGSRGEITLFEIKAV
ncbi:MAG: putative MPP superfamily phosphohydrolase [Halieaceae bacterium]|jgi:predicted MPP superfamily phosphohydrolase